MNGKKVLKKKLITFSFILGGCGSGPVKPLMKIGVPDVPNNRVYVCTTTNATWKSIETAQGLTTEKFQDIVFRNAMFCEFVPLMSVNNGICLDPLNGNILTDYVHDLENYIKFRCK